MFIIYVGHGHCGYSPWTLKDLAKPLCMNENTGQDLEVQEACDKWQNL